MKYIKLAVLFTLLTALYAQELKRVEFNVPFKDEKELDVVISFGLGNLSLKAIEEPGFILKSEMLYSLEEQKPNLYYKVLGNRGLLKLQTEKAKSNISGKKGTKDIKNEWDLRFTTKVPISFDIELGLGEGKIDFTKLLVRDLNLECGLSEVKIRFEEPNKESLRYLDLSTGLGAVEAKGLGNANFEVFNVECGLGEAKLYFDGKMRNDSRGKVKVGLGSVKIYMPDNIGVELRAESSFLSSLDLRGFDRVGEKSYRSGNWRKAQRRIFIELEVGLGSVEFYWLD